MRIVLLTAAILASGVTYQPIGAAEPLKSGLQVGEKIGSIFDPLNVTGPFAGERHCLVCENGANPVIMVFAREPGAAVSRLLTKLDAACADRQRQEVASFAVFLSDKEGLDKELTTIAKRQEFKHVVLAIDPPEGPEGFGVTAEAEVTVVLYRRYQVQANHAYRKGELTDAAIEKIIADVPKIVPDK